MRNNTQRPNYATWAHGVREVPDILVAAQLSLGPLAKGETTPISAEARRIVGDACDLLDVALANLVEVTRSSPGFAWEGDTAPAHRVPRRDPRMSPRSDNDQGGVAPDAEQCALTQRYAGPSNPPHVTTHLTHNQLDRLRWCANGNTLRFESSDIVDALVAAGYAIEGVGRVVTVTPKGLRYLQSHPV